jgi:uncharacterized protein YhaN
VRIRKLHINRFGHFVERDLEFPGNGLQVVCGPNEAGKTTLLEFLRGLLFDFPGRTPYDFGGSGELAGVATIELGDGRIIELRRRKGNKDKVAIKLDGQPTDLGEPGWLRLLDHADRGLFESIFAFGLDRLSQGEASLKHESLQSALFGGSLGGTSSPDKVVAELTRKAEELFKKGGTKPAINLHLAELKRLGKEIKDRSLRPAKYHEVKVAAAKAAEHAQAQQERVDHLRREHSRIEKLLRAWPKWWELRQLRGERGILSAPAGVPADARQRHQVISKELQSITNARTKRTEEFEQAKRGLAALNLDPTAVSYHAEIKSCLELRQSFIEAKDQLPERQLKTDSMRLLIDRELTELRPGWSHDDLRTFTVDVATRNEIDRLSKELGERTSARTSLNAKREKDAANLDRAREELTELGTARDITALAAILADEADFAADKKQLETATGELTKLERKLVAQRRKLTPPLSSDISTPYELPVPRAEMVVEFQARFNEIREQCRTANASVKEDETEQHKIEKSLDTAVSSHTVPSLNERDASRERRDAGWGLVRQKYILSGSVDAAIAAWLDGNSAGSLPDGYERAVLAADNIADRIYDNANEVANREGFRRQLDDLEQRLSQKRKHVAELTDKRDALQAEWFAIWRPCGFEPLAPDAMLGWLKDYEAVCSMITQRDDLIEDRSLLSEKIASFDRRLLAVCGLTNGDSAEMLAYVRRSVDEAKEQQRRTTELRKEIRRLEQQIAKYDADEQSLISRGAAAKAAWQIILNRLHLPADWGMELAREVIEKLNATRVRLDGLPGEEARIAAMQARISEFDQQVNALWQAIRGDQLHEPCEIAIKKMEDQVERAVEAQRKHDLLSQKLAEAHTDIESLGDSCKQNNLELARLFELANVTTEAEFLEMVSQAEKASRLDGAIDQISRDLDLIRAGDNREEFEQSLSTGELAMLQGQERDLQEQLKGAELSRKAADGEEALARGALLQLDGSDEVAILSEQQSFKRSLLATDVDRYMPLVYAKHLLNAAVSRFEKENQPEMIVTVSRLLSQMTDGRYIEFDRTGSGRQNILIRQSDGVEKTPDQLSTGTREQLYLAIRLAYVLHYCKQNQPLPVVIDDVLVNFDDRRARQTLTTLADISQKVQVLFFTCHSHLLNIARDVLPGMAPIELTI